MAEKSFPFNSINGDRKYDADDFASWQRSRMSNGISILTSDNLLVVANNDMSITVMPGHIHINGRSYTNTDEDGPKILYIDTADGVLKRIDRIVARLADREIKVHVLKGEFSDNPRAPALTRNSDIWELCIAEILIDQAVLEIEQRHITDTRYDSELCGIANAIECIDTNVLVPQLVDFVNYNTTEFNDWYNTNKQLANDLITKQNDDFNNLLNDKQVIFDLFMQGLQTILSGDVAGNLLNEINLIKQRLDIVEPELFGARETALKILGEGYEEIELPPNPEIPIESIEQLEQKINLIEQKIVMSDTEPVGQPTGGIWYQKIDIEDIWGGDNSGVTSTTAQKIAEIQTRIEKKTVVSEEEPEDQKVGDIWIQEVKNN